MPGGIKDLAECQRIVEEAKTRVLCKGRAGKNKEKQRRAKVEQRFLLKRDHRRLKPADCHVTRSHNHVVLGIGGWCKNMLLGETRRSLTKVVQEIGPIFGDSIVTVAKLKAIRSGNTIMLE